MQGDWWERPVCYLCDYWWAFLTLLVLGLTGWFTRDLWMPSPEPAIASSPTRVATLGTGDVQATLFWNSTNDLDLWVWDPNEEKIFFQHPNSASGGELDVDANAGCQNPTSRPVENIFWPPGLAIRGGYVISVNYYRQCEDTAATPFMVRLLVDGQTLEFTGTVNVVGETVEIHRFAR